jgi:hypothetical protein
MKKIKVKYCKYNGTDEKDTGTYNNMIHNVLKKYYDVEVSDNPDYVFYHESSYEYLKYDCVRINYTGENISANFNLCDYAIGFDYMSFEDRYYRLPIYTGSLFYREKEIEQAKKIDIFKKQQTTLIDLKKKEEFCSFVYSNYLGDKNRKLFFNKLSRYKKINSGGKYLNNIGYIVDNKLNFESKHKFSIAFENSSRSGYTTEKLLNSIVANTIPIYWGNPKIEKEFNTKRFINCHEYENYDQVIEKIKEIDNNDNLYLQIINEEIFNKNYDIKKIQLDFELFLKNIFDQPIEKAYRRTINPMRSKELENNEKIISFYTRIKNLIFKILSKIYKPFKKIKYLENIKQKILYRK